MTTSTGAKWRMTGVYGYPEEDRKGETWRMLTTLKEASDLPWMCMGDFNGILKHEEKIGGNPKPQRELDGFREAVRVCDFREVRFEGHPFTWTNNRADDDNIQERLDRVLVTESWFDMFPCSMVEHLPRRRSDHAPLKIAIQGQVRVSRSKKKRRRSFRFEKAWLREDECNNIVTEAWNLCEQSDVSTKIARCAGKLGAWSGGRPKDYQKEISRRREEMRVLMTMQASSATLNEIKALDAEIDELELREETHWAQRSRQNWLREGDKNTAFFHKKAKERRERNTIKGVFDDGGTWRETEEEAEAIFVNYFKTLFESTGTDEMQNILDKVMPKVTDEMNNDLVAPYTEEEIIIALKQMHPTKAPGPDGMPALFYKKFWHVVGRDVTDYVLNILNNGAPIENINHTHVVLIPKKKVCTTTKDYRPISLCNVLYKLVSKVISNRLKTVLPSKISESQSAFVPGRLITDNVLVAYELFHYLRKKKKREQRVLWQ